MPAPNTPKVEVDAAGAPTLVDDRPHEVALAVSEDGPGHELLGIAAGVGNGDGEVARPLGIGGVGEHVLDVVHAEGAEEETIGAEFGVSFHRESIRHARALREAGAFLRYP